MHHIHVRIRVSRPPTSSFITRPCKKLLRVFFHPVSRAVCPGRHHQTMHGQNMQEIRDVAATRRDIEFSTSSNSRTYRMTVPLGKTPTLPIRHKLQNSPHPNQPAPCTLTAVGLSGLDIHSSYLLELSSGTSSFALRSPILAAKRGLCHVLSFQKDQTYLT